MSKIIERALTHKAVLIAEIGVNYYDIAKKMNISNMEAAKLMIKKANFRNLTSLAKKNIRS